MNLIKNIFLRLNIVLKGSTDIVTQTKPLGYNTDFSIELYFIESVRILQGGVSSKITVCLSGY